MTDERHPNGWSGSGGSEGAAQDEDEERLSRLPDFERDSPTEVGGGVLEEGGTAGGTGTGMVAGAGSERDLAADEGRPIPDSDLPGQRDAAVQGPVEPGGSQ